jgi:hypothetical protein
VTKNLLILFGLTILPAVAADISGTWKLEGDIAGVHINRTCTIKQAETKISGSCKSQMNDLALAGEVNGSDVTWHYEADYEGTKVTLNFKGTLDGSSIKGKIDTAGTGGDFTATRQ